MTTLSNEQLAQDSGGRGCDVTNTRFRAWLERHDACQPALDWLGDRDAATAWAECPRADWLLWWAAEAGVAVPRALLADIVRAALDWARPASQSPAWPKAESAVVSVIAALDGRGDLDTARAAAEAAARAAEAAAWAALASRAAAEAAASTELANLVRRHMPMPAMEES